MLLRHVASLHSVNHAARPLQSLTHHNIRQNRSGATPAVCSATNQGQLQQRMARGSSNNGSGPDGRDAGDNPVGLTIRTVYGVGGPHTIRWGLLKRPVEPVAQVQWPPSLRHVTTATTLQTWASRSGQRASLAGWQHAQLAGLPCPDRA